LWTIVSVAAERLRVFRLAQLIVSEQQAELPILGAFVLGPLVFRPFIVGIVERFRYRLDKPCG
jgi:hypothetical protein